MTEERPTAHGAGCEETLEQIFTRKREREDIVARVYKGEITTEEAEEWAKSEKRFPFASKPDPTLFDPRSEPEWTLAMVAAWIVWRTPEAVREHWDAYLDQCTEWKTVRTGLTDERVQKSTILAKHDRATLQTILSEAARDRDPSRPWALGPDDSRPWDYIDELWKTLRAGDIVATGILHFLGETTLLRDPPNRGQIPKSEWSDLSPHHFHGGESDSIAGDNDHAARYDKVRVSSRDVLAIWKAEIPASLASAGRACFRWLCEQMKASPNERPKPKQAFLKEATDGRFPGLSGAGFRRQWSAAIEATSAVRWSKSGAPRKKN